MGNSQLSTVISCARAVRLYLNCASAFTPSWKAVPIKPVPNPTTAARSMTGQCGGSCSFAAWRTGDLAGDWAAGLPAGLLDFPLNHIMPIVSKEILPKPDSYYKNIINILQIL